MSDEKNYVWGESGLPLKPLIDENKSLATAIYETFERCDPESVAQIEVDTGRQSTFGELKRRCLSMAQGLKSLGIDENSVVSIIAENSLESQVIMYASFLLGATISPLDPSLPHDIMAECLRLTKPKMTYVDQNDALKNVEAALALTDLESSIVFSKLHHSYTSFQTLLKPLDPEFTPASISNPMDHVAMIVFTSGTSGMPKGAKLSDLFANFFAPMNKYTREDIFLSASCLFWVSGIFTSLTSLANQMRLLLFQKAPEEEYILKTIHRYRPTAWFAPPTSLRRMLSLNTSDYDLSSVKVVVTGGETLSSDNAFLIEKELFDLRASIVQIYGLTETGSPVINSKETNRPGSCGTVKPGICVKIENLNTKKCQRPGEEGEICIKHPYISKGYLNAPSGFDEDGWFRTGDIGYFDKDGYLYIVDRVKDVIRYKSHKIPPADIEHVLRSHPGVKEAAVFGIPNYEDYEHPAAYVVAEKHITERDLHDLVARKLPEFKQLRGGIGFIDSIPKTRTGKLSRRLLRSKMMDEQLSK